MTHTNKTAALITALIGLCILASVAWAAKAPQAVDVIGTALSISGKPLANIEGTFADQKSGRLGPGWKSGKDGKFRVRLKPGTYRVWAYGAMTKAVELVVRPGQREARVSVAGSPYNGLKLLFESPDGKPLSNASIFYGMRGGTGSLQTDVRGSAIIREEGLPLRLFFVLKSVGSAALNIDSEQVLYGEKPLVVRLERGVSISGRILSREGVPLGGVPVIPERKPYEGDPWSGWNTQFGFKSFSHTINAPSVVISRDGDGSFLLGPLPPGDYRVLIGLPWVPEDVPAVDLIEPARREVSLSSEKSLDGLDLRVSAKEPLFSLQGRVTKSDKSPLASSEISVSVSGQYKLMFEPEEWYLWEPVRRVVTTDADGRFKLFPVRPGKYTLVAKWGKLSATKNVTVSADTTGVEFTLR